MNTSLSARPTRLTAIDWGRWAALVIAALVSALSIRYNTFTPWGSDPASYIEAAHRWAEGRLFEPSPLPLTLPWTSEGNVTVPIGTRPSLVAGTDVSEYPPGLPILMAAGVRLAGDAGAFLVAPIAAGITVLCAYALGQALAGTWAGLLAAVLTALSPITLVSAVQPMGDGPTTALWLLALCMSLRGGAGPAAAGASAGLAILIRPNLAPLGAVLALVVAARAVAETTGDWRAARRAVVAFAVTGSLGVGTLMWTQAALYGGPFTPSYRDITGWFSRAHIPKNVEIHSRYLVAVHSRWIATALLAPFVALMRGAATPAARARRRLAVAMLAIIGINVASYLPYTPYDDPFYLRFFLPAITLAFVFLAALTVWAARGVARASFLLAPIALVPVLIVMWTPHALMGFPFTLRDTMWRVVPMGRYLQSALPPRTVAFVHFQGAAMAYYTGAPVVRLDLVTGAELGRLVGDLERRGFTVVFLADDLDLDPVRAAFKGDPLAALDWPPRVRSVHHGEIAVWFAADRARFARGERWPTDVLRLAP